VDFGTTATAAAVREPDGRVSGLVLANGAATMPSSVFASTTGLLVGFRADDAAGYEPDRYEPTPKRCVGRARVLLGDREFRPAELVAAVYAAIMGEAVRQHDRTPPTTLVLTHPVSWTGARLEVLRTAVGLAGGQLGIPLPEPEFIPEPVAAAVYYANSRTEDAADTDTGSGLSDGGQVMGGDSFLAVYDLGGGTFDATVLHRTASGFEVLASGGIDPLGGFDFDSRLFRYLGPTHGQKVEPESWQMLSAPDPNDHESGMRHRVLLASVRQLKEDLSEHTQQTIRVPGKSDPVLVTRAELETLIRADIEATVAELRGTVARAGVAVEQLADVYRIGGASRTPLVGTLLDQLHRPVRVVDHPKTVVSLGAATPPSAQDPEQSKTTGEIAADSNGHRPANGTPMRAESDEPAGRSRLAPAGRLAWPRRNGHATVDSPGAVAVIDDTTRNNGTRRTEPMPFVAIEPVHPGHEHAPAIQYVTPIQYVAPALPVAATQSIAGIQPTPRAAPAAAKLASPRIPFILAGLLAAMAVVFAALSAPSSDTTVQPGMLTVAGVDPAAGIPVIDLAKPIAVTVTNPEGDRVALALDVVGTTIGHHDAPLRPGGQGAMATVRSPVHPYLMAGRLTAMVTVLRGQNVVATYRFAIQSTQPATTTALAVTTVVLALFALAFLESSMRALRQARDRVTATIGVPMSAAALALAGLTAVWILTERQPATETVLGSVELAAAAGIAAVMGANRVGRAYRSRRSRRVAIARF
jgi:hypothetical protein